jgi:hypothetical protein
MVGRMNRGAEARRFGLAAVLAALWAAAAPADIIIKKDGTRIEGDVKLQGDAYVVTNIVGPDGKPTKSTVRVPLGEVARVLETSTSSQDRFRAKPNERDLALLVSRAGLGIPRDKVGEAVAEVLKAPDGLRAADDLIEKWKLDKKHTAAIVAKHCEVFEKEYGQSAVIIGRPGSPTESRTKHYVVCTNAGAALANEIVQHMEAIFYEYENRLIFREKISEKFVCKVYATREEYVGHGGMAMSAAYYSSALRELVTFAEQAKENMFHSLYHEGMHQFLHYYVPDPPIWFDEGMAQYFETAKYYGRTGSSPQAFRVGLKKEACAQYLRFFDARNLPSLAAMLKMSKQQFYTVNVQMNYAMAWALTHFMLEGGNRQLMEMWRDYFFILRDGATQEEVNQKVFFNEKVNFAAIETLFRSYVAKL